jgi:hypothetical protein
MARGSVRRRAAGIAVVIAALALIVQIETWAIENVPTEMDYCNATLSSDLARVLGDACSDSGAPIAIVH